jgi:glycosyltransferase involved in cell wall biosynthesis
VVPDQTGFLVPVGDSGELARKTHLILNDPKLARSLGVRGKARMQREFSIEKMVERYAALYRTLVAS